MTNTRHFRWFIVLILIALVGCNAQQLQPTATTTPASLDTPTATPALPTATEEPATQTPTSESREVPMTPTPADATPNALQRLIQQAKEDLAARQTIAVEEIEVVRAEAVVWPDSSLGCPQPGMSYTQVQVDGALIQLKAGGRLYSYHSGGMRGPFLCETPDKPTPPSQLPSLDPNDS